MMDWAKRLAALIEAAIRMVMALFGAVLGDEWDGVKPAARRLGAAAKGAVPGVVADAGRAAGRGIGQALTLPLHAVDLTASAVGQTLGALLPSRPVTAKSVADAAVERDDARTHRVDPEVEAAHEGVTAACLTGIRIQGAASSLLSRPGALHATYSDELTPNVTAWLEGLSPAQLKAVVDAPSHVLNRHVGAKSRADLIPGVPRVLSTVARLAKEAAGGELDMEGMLAQAKKNLRNSGHEAAEMAKRGTFRRPPQEPDESGEVIPFRGPRPTPRPSFG